MLSSILNSTVPTVATGRPRLSNDTAADVSVIIVNYGTADLALEAVKTVLDHGDRVRDIHLVDNASPGNDADVMAREIAARGWGDRVRLHAEKTNHGFGRGNNLVLEKLIRETAPPDKVFLLNPDARLGNAAIDVLAAFLDANPDVGAAGARIEKPDHVPVTAAFRFPSLISTFSDAVSFGPLSRLCARWQVPLAARYSNVARRLGCRRGRDVPDGGAAGCAACSTRLISSIMRKLI